MNILQGQQGQILTNNYNHFHPCYNYHTTPVVLASATTTMGALFSLISLYLPQSPPLLWFRKRVKRFLSFTHAFSYILPIARKIAISSTSRTEVDYFGYQSHGSFFRHLPVAGKIVLKLPLYPCYRRPKTPQMVINIALYIHIMLQ